MVDTTHRDSWWTDRSSHDSEHTPLLPVPDMEEQDEHRKIFGEELVHLVKSGLPIFGTHLLEYSLITASVVTIGHLSTTALAAVTLGSMTASVSGFSIIQGLSSALDTVLPSAWTSSQPTMVGIWTHRMVVVMGICLVPMFVVWFEAEPLLLWLRQDPEIARLAAIYLRWVSIGLPAYAFNCISRRYFQSQVGLFTVPTRIIMIVAPLNALLNWLLVFGPEPIRLGYIGAPIATAGMNLSFNMVSLLSVGYGVVLNRKNAWHPVCWRSFQNLGILFRLGMAGVGSSLSLIFTELIALAASQISPLALATQSVLLVSTSTAYQGPFALGIASSVRIGNLLGEGLASRAKIAANASIALGLAFATFTCTLFLLLRYKWAYIFNDDPSVVSLVASILPLVGLFQYFDGTAAVTGGILRARGKQVIGAFLNLSAYYIIGLPLGIFLTFYPKVMLGLYGLWIGLTVSLVYCAFFGTWLCVRTDWDEEVCKVRERLAKERRLIGVVLPDELESGEETEGE
ncbi:mate-domain-containing protein [Mycena albidolilacea]|uniref:Mate-domain-containing protein n=1 Tax=Mycena albidolilacea TaxID=1033008 RepID=A0AAD7ECB2_9AGAR|nr:mate-domain-containing protein [Mycena albidolilacea]